MALRTSVALNDAVQALVRGDPEAVDMAFDNLKNRVRPLVPGIMASRALNFIDVAKNDWKKYDNAGRLRYEATPGEAVRSILGPTVESRDRVDQWQQVSTMEGYYRRMRSLTIESFMAGDYNQFERYQEQLIANFGRWITPQDIRQEMELQEMTARERQMIGLPATVRDAYWDRWGT